MVDRKAWYEDILEVQLSEAKMDWEFFGGVLQL